MVRFHYAVFFLRLITTHEHDYTGQDGSPQTSLPSFSPNYSNPSIMMSTGHRAVPSTSFAVKRQGIPRVIIDVDQPTFAFGKRASRSRYGSLSPAAIAIQFRGKDPQHPDVLAVQNSTFLKDGNDSVLRLQEHFPPMNATLRIQVKLCFPK